MILPEQTLEDRFFKALDLISGYIQDDDFQAISSYVLAADINLIICHRDAIDELKVRMNKQGALLKKGVRDPEDVEDFEAVEFLDR